MTPTEAMRTRVFSLAAAAIIVGMTVQGMAAADKAMVLPVDPAPLIAETSTGHALFKVEIADEAREAKARFTGTVAAYEGTNDGFTTTSKAASLAELWEYQVDDLCKRTAMAGGLLEDSADGYREMEQAVLETLPPLSSAE